MLTILLGNNKDNPYYLTEETLIYGAEHIRLDDLEEYLQVENYLISYQLSDPRHTLLVVTPMEGLESRCFGCDLIDDCFDPTGDVMYYQIHINDLMYCCHAKLSMEELLDRAVKLED